MGQRQGGVEVKLNTLRVKVYTEKTIKKYE